MTDERWARVKALFQAAIERPEAERPAFVAAAAGDDEALRRNVESLLASDAADASFLDRVSEAAETVLAETLPSLSAGQRIGSYEVVAPIGAGAMGEVYRARDTRLHRDVALKVLPGAFALDPERLTRFRREAQMLAALNHPNIAAIYGLEESSPSRGSAQTAIHALVLELVDGPTLADRLQHGPLPLDEALVIARQIADALEAAHEKGIVHRDLKPANVKIAVNGTVKVLDFGLAKVWEGAPAGQAPEAPTVTATHLRGRAILGTPSYMSPEQARGKAVDRRTDIWSFGCVLFEMLTGRVAFAGETISDTIARVLEREVAWDALPAATPDRVRDLLRRCLRKDAARRLRDIGDARLELDEALTAPEAPAAVAPRRALPARRRLARFVATGAAATVVVLAAVFVAEQRRSEPQPTFRQLTFRHGAIRGARIAPDGQTVVYSATWIGAPLELYIIRPGNPFSGSMGLANAGIFSVSSRGELAVALGCRLNWGECIGTLARVPITGGSPREMVEDVHVADWSPDGQDLAVVSFAGGTFRLEYPIGKVLYKAPGWITHARVSPRGDRVAFLDHPRLGDIGGSVVVVDAAGRMTTLSSGWRSLQGLAWATGGDEVWFTGSRTGRGGSSALYAVTLSGEERTVFASPGTLKLNDISRDGREVLFTRGTTRGGIMGLGADDGKERELSWFDYSTVADLSHDGRTLLFYEWGEGVEASPTVFIRKIDGGDAIQLGEGRPLALSPDGQWAVAVQENGAQELVLLPTGIGEVKRLPRGAIVEYLDWAAWSPDGRRIFFAGQESPDVRRTYVQDIDGGDPRPVTPEGFVGMLLSPDGRTIAAIDRYGEYYLCSLDESVDPRPLAGYVDGDFLLQWSGDGRFLFVREAGNLVLRIHTLELSTGRRQFWKELIPPDPTVLIDIGSDPGQVRITPDGRSYAYTYWTFEGELYVAEGLE